MTDTISCAYGILLAGGKSSRMNQDKALLRLGNSNMTLLDYQKKRLSSVSDLVIVSRNERPYVQDMYKNCGPLAGIHAAISFVGETAKEKLISDALVLPIDTPLISSELLFDLIKAGRSKQAVTYFEGNNLPIYLPNMGSALVKLSQLLSNNQRIINSFLQEISAVAIPCSDPKKVANANTPMQWKIMKRSIKS